MKKIVLDVKETLGDLFFIGCEPAYKNENNKKTTEIIGYNYNLVSSVQGDTVKIKVLGDQKEFTMMQKVELIGLETKIYARAKNNFADVMYSFTAYDLKNAM